MCFSAFPVIQFPETERPNVRAIETPLLQEAGSGR